MGAQEVLESGLWVVLGIGTLSEPIQAPLNDRRDSTSAQNFINPTSYPCDGTGKGLSRLMFSGMISFNLYPLMAPEGLKRSG